MSTISSDEASEEIEEEWDSEDAEDFCEDADRYNDMEGMAMLRKYIRNLGIEENQSVDDIYRDLKIRKGNHQFQKGLRKRRAVEMLIDQDKKMRLEEDKRYRQLKEYDVRVNLLIPTVRSEILRDLQLDYQNNNLNINDYQQRIRDLEYSARQKASHIVREEDRLREVNIRSLREIRTQLYNNDYLHFKKLPKLIVERIMNIAMYAELYENPTELLLPKWGGVKEGIRTFSLYLGLDPYGKSFADLHNEIYKVCWTSL